MEDKDRKIIQGLVKRFASDGYDPQLLEMFQEWLSLEANTADKDEALYEVWNDSDTAGSRKHAEKVFEKIKVRTGIESPQKRLLTRRIMRIAAMIAVPLLVVASLWIYIRDNGDTAGELAAVPAMVEDQAQYMLLDDGSQVWYGTHGTVSVDDERETRLVGDALYNVKREYLSGKRFRVRTEHLTVTVFGTVFRVTALPDAEETVVTLYEGTLGVTIPSGNYMMDSGTRFTYNNHTGEYTTEEIGDVWPEQIEERVFVYRSESISSVFEEIERLYGVTVDYGGYSWPAEEVTLKFPAATNLENVLFMLSGISGNLGYRITDDMVYIFDK